MRKKGKKLTLGKETLRRLSNHNLKDIQGAASTACTPTCPQTITCECSADCSRQSICCP